VDHDWNTDRRGIGQLAGKAGLHVASALLVKGHWNEHRVRLGAALLY
jgi:hypothetical protein